jgi:hypothetical protein
MKIIGIFGEKSTEKRLALITYPQMTEDVLNALSVVCGNQLDRYQPSLDSELLMVSPPLMEHHVQMLDGFLTEAERLVTANRRVEEKDLHKFLEAAAKQAGLPLK